MKPINGIYRSSDVAVWFKKLLKLIIAFAVILPITAYAWSFDFSDDGEAAEVDKQAREKKVELELKANLEIQGGKVWYTNRHETGVFKFDGGEDQYVYHASGRLINSSKTHDLIDYKIKYSARDCKSAKDCITIGEAYLTAYKSITVPAGQARDFEEVITFDGQLNRRKIITQGNLNWTYEIVPITSKESK